MTRNLDTKGNETMVSKQFRSRVIAVGLAMFAGAAFATVTFDPLSGAGFVGKGDVQLAFGWNNATLQTNAGSLSFSEAVTESYTAVCTWVTGEGTRGEKTHNVTHTLTTEVSGAVQYDARTHKQVDGFILTGFGPQTVSGTVPVVDGPCPGNAGTGGTWSSVQLDSALAGLYVTFGTDTKLLLSLQ